MSLSRATAALLAGSGALLATGCVAALGLNEEKESAIDKLCNCDGLQLAVYGGSDKKQECVADLTHRLEIATEPTRAAWLQNYDAQCKGTCANWEACFRIEPTCRQPADSCTADPACCVGHCCNGKCSNQPCQDGGA